MCGIGSNFCNCLSQLSVERTFNAVIKLLDSKRNRLEIVNRGDLRLFPTNLKPDVDELITKHQPHPSRYKLLSVI